jgi:hypothetical protein
VIREDFRRELRTAVGFSFVSDIDRSAYATWSPSNYTYLAFVANIATAGEPP